jgi:hypothetical protein
VDKDAEILRLTEEQCNCSRSSSQSEIVRLKQALRQIGDEVQRLFEVCGEPSNYIPEYCQAVLDGKDVEFKKRDQLPNVTYPLRIN